MAQGERGRSPGVLLLGEAGQEAEAVWLTSTMDCFGVMPVVAPGLLFRDPLTHLPPPPFSFPLDSPRLGTGGRCGGTLLFSGPVMLASSCHQEASCLSQKKKCSSWRGAGFK